MNILGIWDGHDAGAALLIDGRLVAAANEERFSRRKLEVRFPEASIAACMAIASLDPNEVDVVAVSTSDPAKALGRLAPWTEKSSTTTCAGARSTPVQRPPSRAGPNMS